MFCTCIIHITDVGKVNWPNKHNIKATHSVTHHSGQNICFTVVLGYVLLRHKNIYEEDTKRLVKSKIRYSQIMSVIVVAYSMPPVCHHASGLHHLSLGSGHSSEGEGCELVAPTH